VGGDGDLRNIDIRQRAGMYNSGHKRSLVLDVGVGALKAYNNAYVIMEP